MIQAVGQEDPDLVFFLGDGERDLPKLIARFPDLPLQAVRGNCDLRSELPQKLICAAGGLSILAVHGHYQDVKYESRLDSLRRAAEEAGADIVLFGHTHDARKVTYDGRVFLNPGSIGTGLYPTYAVIEKDGEETKILIKELKGGRRRRW